ncbi:hypothetical protein HD553DRAFT_319306 [Filobasidium floriforme]|uniref:uncharacterized protein n=1 Tax=Filobasidium floriforme TaxID=5210 RepID=UPI001E8CCD5D|nr:uncharacterized protein HD553DRAFT_319306 [Filobasidium floriforme]KAH8078559.1 hypothetical protein HD553DRAFT_319306 [Filobasidium floriforme]
MCDHQSSSSSSLSPVNSTMSSSSLSFFASSLTCLALKLAFLASSLSFLSLNIYISLRQDDRSHSPMLAVVFLFSMVMAFAVS